MQNKKDWNRTWHKGDSSMNGDNYHAAGEALRRSDRGEALADIKCAGNQTYLKGGGCKFGLKKNNIPGKKNYQNHT